MNHLENSDDNDDGSSVDLAFANVDFAGVNFDDDKDKHQQLVDEGDPAFLTDGWDPVETKLFAWESSLPFDVQELSLDDSQDHDEEESYSQQLVQVSKWLANGQYDKVIRSKSFQSTDESFPSFAESIKRIIIAKERNHTLINHIHWELVGIAAFSLFLQNNYTGPALEKEQLETLIDINPHPCFREYLEVENGESIYLEGALTKTEKTSKFQNKVLSELAVDGEWPCQVCSTPYFLLLARCIFSALSGQSFSYNDSENHINCRFPLKGLSIWHSRCILAHHRLMQSQTPSISLWKQTEAVFEVARDYYCKDAQVGDTRASTVMLEFGLAEHHFDRPKNGIDSFRKAQTLSGLSVSLTGAHGVRTKFQKRAIAQLRVDAIPREKSNLPKEGPEFSKIKDQMVPHSEDEILLEEVKYNDHDSLRKERLPILDQCILLSLCLDVKNSNAMDGLTAEEMGAFLARVLEHHDDWMVYSSGLLERAWLEFERSHARERSILQLQALLDQHTNRLTLTQSTRQSIEESAPVQDRLKNLHMLVYPPRWTMIQDLADRYASLGVVTSAAELYSEIELWDYVVECYKRAGKVSKAEQIVREQLDLHETPRMWTALGSLKNDPECFEKAIELSNGRFSNAFVSLAEFYFERGEIEKAAVNYKRSLEIKPLAPRIWFRTGTISMQLQDWDEALISFSNVVQQEPEESDAWANVAAVHLHNKRPLEAYPALNESLKFNRNNWRVWTTKLYTCLDLGKYDEAIQSTNLILDLTRDKNMAQGTRIDPKCVKGLTGAVLKKLGNSEGDKFAVESIKRTVERLHDLLERLVAELHDEPWTHESLSFFYKHVGRKEDLLESLHREYKILQSIDGWENDKELITKVCEIALEMCQIYALEGTREALTKARFLVKGLIKKIEKFVAEDTILLKTKHDELTAYHNHLEQIISNL